MDSDVTVVVTSCDAYADVEKPFFALWQKYWPDCPFEVVLLTETAQNNFPCRTIYTGKGKTWCAMLVEALEQITTPYVMLLMNDYYLTAKVNTAQLLKRVEDMRRYNAINLRLIPNPPIKHIYKDTDLGEYPKNTAYCVACQAGFWDREVLRSLASRNRSAWEFERYGSYMLRDEARPILATRTKEFPFVDAVHKGYWEEWGIAAAKDNGIELDFAVRSAPPLGVRIKEGLKRIIFLAAPELVVRIQNIFNAGKK